MTKTYAIADLHGRADLLLLAYERLRWPYQDVEPGLIVHLGDYVDRGPQSREVIEILMDPDSIPQDFHRLVLKGNHEQMLVETIRKHLNPAWWMSNGGKQTLESYGHPKIRVRYNEVWPYNPGVIPEDHVAFLEGLGRLYCDRHRVYVHAAVDEKVTLPEQNNDYVLWHCRWDDTGYRGYHVVHGHVANPKGPVRLVNRTNLDVEAYETGRLVIGVFDDDTPGGPIEIIEVKA
jgi:serine/threonine protein phosphatase 1